MKESEKEKQNLEKKDACKKKKWWKKGKENEESQDEVKRKKDGDKGKIMGKKMKKGKRKKARSRKAKVLQIALLSNCIKIFKTDKASHNFKKKQKKKNTTSL